MNQPMRKYFRPGIIAFMSYPSIMGGEGDIEGVIRRIAADPYFDAVEITWIKDAAVRARVRKLLDSSHMTVIYGAQPRLLTTGLNINHMDPAQNAAALETLKQGMDEAYEKGASGYAFLSATYDEQTNYRAYQILLENTGALCRYAAERGNMPVNLEVFDWDVDKKSLIGPVELVLRFARDMRERADNFGLTVDLSHLPLLRETARESLIPVKEFITHAHIGNAVCSDPSYPAYGDAHPRFGFPNGANDTKELTDFLQVLLEIGYFNTGNPPVVSFEVKPFGDEDPEIVIANGKRVLEKAWVQVNSDINH
ncbi:MAG: sugar phosphate isomerase/epimerase [Oscillospiraceae bacterium]|nr:sugar phosphate isomerase/epimerase [Oscillospiraceae bacterium]